MCYNTCCEVFIVQPPPPPEKKVELDENGEPIEQPEVDDEEKEVPKPQF